MISFFPTPYPDELLYSVLGRYHKRSGNYNYKSTMLDLFGDKNATAAVELPCRIDILISNMPISHKYTAEDLIYKHTLLPFYSSFLQQDQVDECIELMRGVGGNKIYNKLGLVSNKISRITNLKFCSMCYKEDIERYGESYWHRQHQIPGVVVCTKHLISLNKVNLPINTFDQREYKMLTEQIYLENLNKIEVNEKDFDKLILLAKDVDYILNNNLPHKEQQWFSNQYKNKLKEINLATATGVIKTKQLYQNFKEFYGETFLELQQCTLEDPEKNNKVSDWLKVTIRGVIISRHPIKHLLIARFLEISVDDLFLNKIDYKPFGEGPWPCLNPVCDNYLKHVINHISIGYDDNTNFKCPVGTFKCPCGFTYIRKSLGNNSEDEFRKYRVIDFGFVWENKLKEYLDNNLTLKEISIKLGISIPIVRKYIETNINKHTNNNDKKEKSNKKLVTDIDIEIYRKKWLEFRHRYPNKSITELRKLDYHLTRWLKENDSDWFLKNKPPIKSNHGSSQRHNWEEKDKELLHKLKKIISDMLYTKEKPIKITVVELKRRLGKTIVLSKMSDKLPRTKKYLSQIIETNKEFIIRKFKWAINELEKEGLEATWDQARKKLELKEYSVAKYKKEILKILNLKG
ncbi:TnsD family transposase [Candidatus Clostridium radicumherbarum]|uniref:TnsD family transposase n=1 Tax=Candidatus Clostridium radicumherbarum TaxID=3381662 RepID=A0ABW8TWT9_9CLOT